MNEIYTESPFAWWAILYGLIYLMLLFREWGEYGGMNIELALRLLLWPLLCALGLVVLIAVGVDALWHKLFAKKDEKR